MPQSMVIGETRRILADIVQQEQSRGVTDEAIKEGEKELVEIASRGAREKLKGDLHPPAYCRGRKSERHPAEMRARIASMAARYGMTPDKAAKEMEKRDAMDRVAEEILSNKVIEFLVGAAELRVEVPPEPPVA